MPAGLAARDDSNTYALYQYTPSLIAACISAAAFAVATLLHATKSSRLRLKILIPFVFGLAFETIG
ncbi:hypothetical protein ETB97_011380 [Aspergillus alliaceus]|uniref:Uncharacterized protein n=1 Tax=Petromyces alliaceus TaxID=209559 RepID=A0A8H6AGV4_PETAA|nr:hypothetical protein ETB97_011380 [Aspergillus burnettii]